MTESRLTDKAHLLKFLEVCLGLGMTSGTGGSDPAERLDSAKRLREEGNAKFREQDSRENTFDFGFLAVIRKGTCQHQQQVPNACRIWRERGRPTARLSFKPCAAVSLCLYWNFTYKLALESKLF